MKRETILATVALGVIGYAIYTMMRPAAAASAPRALPAPAALPVYTAADLAELNL